MGRKLLLLALPVLLQSVLTSADIYCFSDYSKDGSGVQKNGICQIKYNLDESSGCPIMVNPPILTAPGRRPAQKVLGDQSASVTLDSCRFDGPSLVCNCNTDYCNKNFYKLWPSVLSVLEELSEECRIKVIPPNQAKMDPLKNTTNPITNTTLERVKVEPAIECGVTGSETTEKGHACVTEIVLVEGACYAATGKQPTFSAVINNNEQVCTSPNTIRVTCNTNNCNTDIEKIKQQIESGTGLNGGNLNPKCKEQLLGTLDQLPGFGVPVVQTPTEAPNPCGPGGAVGTNGTCECKTGWVDIITMKDLPEGHNHTEGELCVTENACVLKSEQHVIMLILDASGATHNQNGTFEGMKNFVLKVENLIDKSSNEIVFVAYGGSETRVGSLTPGWTSPKFKDRVNRVLADNVGKETNIADGFEKAKQMIDKYERSVKRIVIHVGDGSPTVRAEACQPAYEQLAAVVDRFIAVAVARDHENMSKNWHTPDDFVDFTTVRYENLNLDNMKFLMQKVCPQQPYEELIRNSLRLTKE